MAIDFSSALPTFVITLREGVEATLVVGIVLAYLKKAKQTQLNAWVYGGVGAGILASALVGILFSLLIKGLGEANQQYAPVIEPILETTFSVLAIVLLSWMLIWMTQQAKGMKSQVEGAIGTALKDNQAGDNQAGWGIFGLIFFAVLREGFETVLFIAAKFQQGVVPALGAFSGLAVAVLIGVLLFKWGVKINIRLFFQVMGVFLLMIVAGLVISALGHLDTAVANVAQMSRRSADLCFYYERFTKEHACILGPMVLNTAKALPDDKFPGIVLHALFGYTDKLYLVQAVGYGLFLLTVGGIYLQNLTGWTKPALKDTKRASEAIVPD